MKTLLSTALLWLPAFGGVALAASHHEIGFSETAGGLSMLAGLCMTTVVLVFLTKHYPTRGVAAVSWLPGGRLRGDVRRRGPHGRGVHTTRRSGSRRRCRRDACIVLASVRPLPGEGSLRFASAGHEQSGPCPAEAMKVIQELHSQPHFSIPSVSPAGTGQHHPPGDAREAVNCADRTGAA